MAVGDSHPKRCPVCGANTQAFETIDNKVKLVDHLRPSDGGLCTNSRKEVR
jgi:hypothetical protein